MKSIPKSMAYNVDCMEYMKSIGDHEFDLSIVDPPYGIGEGDKKNSSRGYCVPPSKWDDEEWDIEPPSQEYFDQLFRVSKRVIIWGCNYMDFAQKTSSPGRIVWNKINGVVTFADGEMAWTNCINSLRIVDYMWNGMMQGVSIKRGRTQQGKKALNEKRIQAGQKPVKLYEEILKRYANEGDKIFDSHLGSGSHRIAAFNMKFDFVGCEISEKRFLRQEERFHKHTCIKTLF